MSGDESMIVELFGESFAEKLQQHRARNWRIQDAMTTEYTNREKNPPSGVSQHKRARIRLGDVSEFIIQRAETEYGMSDEAETIKKLLRNGLQEIHLQWGDDIVKIEELGEAITYSSGYLIHDISIPTSGDEWELDIESNRKSERRYIIWCQDFQADKLSETLNMHKSEVLQLAIIMAGRELAAVGDIPDQKSIKIEEEVEKVGRQLQERRCKLEQLAFGTIMKAWSNENCDSLQSDLHDNCPEVLEMFNEKIQEIQGNI